MLEKSKMECPRDAIYEANWYLHYCMSAVVYHVHITTVTCTYHSTDGVGTKCSWPWSAAGRSAVLHCAAVCKGGGRGTTSLSEGPQTRVIGVSLHRHHENQLCQGTNTGQYTSYTCTSTFSCFTVWFEVVEESERLPLSPSLPLLSLPLPPLSPSLPPSPSPPPSLSLSPSLPLPLPLPPSVSS